MQLIKKETIKSKSFWLGLVTLAGGVVALAYGETEKGITAIIAGAAMICGRDAISKMQ